MNKVVIIKNVKLSYLDFGDLNSNNCILILHGWGLSKYPYESIAHKIPGSYRVVILDLPGFGNSDSPLLWTYDEYAETVLMFIQSVIQKSVILIGHSFGGGVAIALASKHSHFISLLVLVDSAGIPMNRSPLILIIYKTLEVFLQSLSIKRIIPVMQMSLSFAYNLIVHPWAMWNSLRLPNYVDISDKISKIKCKVVVMWAARDKMIPVQSATILAGITGSEIIWAPPNLYHDWPITNPGEFVSLLRPSL